MSVCLVIASRGRNALLREILSLTLSGAIRDDTRIVVTLDEDDPQEIPDDPRIIVSIGAREDSLGAKYNRGYRSYPQAELYVLFFDTLEITTPGWDETLLTAARQFGDGIGAVYLGENQGPLALPQTLGLTSKFIEIQGYFLPEYFSFWWHDTWINEVAQLTGRVVLSDVKLGTHRPGKKTRGAREIVFWATCYYNLRHERYSIARRIIDASDYPGWQKQTLYENLEYWGDMLNSRESKTGRNPEWAQWYEEKFGFDAPEDERYSRVKRAMIEKMRNIA